MTWNRRRRLVATLVVASVVAVLTLAAATWRLVSTERELGRQRSRERLEFAADATAARLETRLAERLRLARRILASDRPASAFTNGDGAPPTFVALLTPERLRVEPPSAVAYRPDVQPFGLVWSPAVFDEAERLEFRRGDLDAAAGALRRLTESERPDIRAGALMRLARVQRKAGLSRTALDTYADLARIDARIDGLPAELLARFQRCAVLEELEDVERLSAEAQVLLGDLTGGRWALAPTSYRHHAEAIRRWCPSAASGTSPAERQAMVLEQLWRRWMSADERAQEGSRLLWADDAPFLITEVESGDRRAAIIDGESNIGTLLEHAQATPSKEIAVSLADPLSGRSIAGDERPGSLLVARTPADTALPFALRLGAAPTPRDPLVRRRTVLLVGGAILVGSLFLGSVWMFSRAALDQMRLGRMQADFLAAVSHEFRSPLTAVRHISELLAEDRLPSERRAHLIEALGVESTRLQRLVEDLLDFRRLQQGTMQIQPRRAVVSDLVERVGQRAAKRVAERDYRLETEVCTATSQIDADPDSLGRAIDNLLDNAVAYSPDCRTVWLGAEAKDGEVRIWVRDRGIGIAEEDQEDVFEHFVRGRAAAELRSRGAGLGLSLVREIVQAHGGHVELESALGVGSTFTLVLPLLEPGKRETL